MCRDFMIVLFMGFISYNIYLAYICIKELLSINDNIFEEDPDSAASMFVIQAITEFLNALCGLIFVCFKVQLKSVLFAWFSITVCMMCISFSWEIWFVSRENYKFDAYTFNTCVFIKAVGFGCLFVVYNYIREFVVISNKNAVV